MVTFTGGLELENQTGFLELEDGKTALQSEQSGIPATAATDFIDYIFQFPDQGTFQRDPAILASAPLLNGSPTGVQLLIYNPVETLTSAATGSNILVFPPQQANSSVALSGFWVMITIKGLPILQLYTHPNLQILNDRTLMFAQQPSVLINNIDVSHINIVINIFGNYVRDGLTVITVPNGALTDDASINFLLQDGTSTFLLAG